MNTTSICVVIITSMHYKFHKWHCKKRTLFEVNKITILQIYMRVHCTGDHGISIEQERAV
jgi:hypothetical protein